MLRLPDISASTDLLRLRETLRAWARELVRAKTTRDVRRVNDTSVTAQPNDLTVCDTERGAVTAYLPAAASCPGRDVVICKRGSGTLTIRVYPGDLINGTATSRTAATPVSRFESDGSVWWI